DEAMDAIHRRIGTPLVTGLRLAGASGLALDQDSVTPARLPDLFVGAPLVVAGRIEGKSTGESASAAVEDNSSASTASEIGGAGGAAAGVVAGDSVSAAAETGGPVGAGVAVGASASAATEAGIMPAIIISGEAADGSAWSRRVSAVETSEVG